MVQKLLIPDSDKPSDLWTYRRMISWEECPHLHTPEELDYRKALIEWHGENSAFVRSMLNGEFSREQDAQFVFTEKDLLYLRLAMARYENGEKGQKYSTVRAGGDVSAGGDEQIIYARHGLHVFKPWIGQDEDTHNASAKWVKFLRGHAVKPFDAYFDAGGVGKPIINSMEEAWGYRGIHRYYNHQQPTLRSEYKNKITEDHFKFKRILRTYPLVIPHDNTLLDQAKKRRFDFDELNRAWLEKKAMHISREKSSPDRLEALIMSFSDFQEPPKTEAPKVIDRTPKKKNSTSRSFQNARRQKNVKEMRSIALQRHK